MKIDFITLLNNTNDYTFQGDSTYFIGNQINLTGLTAFEGGAVIKGTNGTLSSRLLIQGPVDCRATSYRPIIFTGKNDNLFGEIVSGSTSNAATNWNGIYVNLAGNTNAIDFHDVRIYHAYYGFKLDNLSQLTLSHSELASNWAAVVTTSSGIARLRNVLVYDGTYAFGSGSSNLVGGSG